MPIAKVQLPDGRTARFEVPEGTTPEQVMAFARDNLPQPAAPAPAAPDISMAEGIASAASQGLTFGFNDEISAAVNAAAHKLTHPGDSFVDTYKANVANYRDRLNQFREQHPYVATAAEIGGAVPTAFVPIGTLGRAAQGAGAAGKTYAAAKAGAAGGAVYGFGAGEGGIVDRSKSAAAGALLGAAGGAAAPAGGAAVRNVVGRRLTNKAAAAAGIPKSAYGILSRAADADQSLYGSGAARIRAAGPQAMLADAGPNTLALLDTAVQKSGPAGAVAREAIEQRASQAGHSVNSALDDAFGTPGPSGSHAMGAPRATISQLYERAYSKPIDYSSPAGRRIEQDYLSRVPPSAINAANDLMRVEGAPLSKQIMATIADDGTISYQRMPDVRQIDYITRGLNQVAEEANGKGKLGGTTQRGRAYANLSRDLRSALKDTVPEYRDALDVAAGAIREGQAKEFGATLLSARVTRDEAADMLSGMGGAERRKASEGVRTYIDDVLANIKRALTDNNMDAREAIRAVKDLSSRAAREKTQMLLGRDAAARLFGELDRATVAFELRAGVAQNSKTFARTALDEAIQQQTRDGVVNALRSGEPINAGRRLTQALLGRTPADQQRISDATYSALVRALTELRGEDAARLLERIRAASSTIPGTAEKYGLLTQRGLQAVAIPVSAQVREQVYP